MPLESTTANAFAAVHGVHNGRLCGVKKVAGNSRFILTLVNPLRLHKLRNATYFFVNSEPNACGVFLRDCFPRRNSIAFT